MRRSQSVAVTGLFLLSLVGIPSAARSQEEREPDLTIFYDHGPPGGAGVRTPRVRSEPALKRDLRRDPPGRYLIAQGSNICIQPEHANPLLYTYSLGVETREAALPEGFSDFLTALLAGVDQSRARAERPPQLTDDYLDELRDLFEWLVKLRRSKLESDLILRFLDAHARALALRDSAEATNTLADDAYERLRSSTADELLVQMLRTLQLDLWNRIGEAYAEFEAGLAILKELERGLCATIEDKLTVLSLSIEKRVVPAGSGGLVRPDGRIVAIEFEPVSVKRFDIGYGAILSAFVQDKTRFSVDAEGIVRAEEDNSVRFRPGVFAFGRGWDVPWLWGTIGLAADGDGVSDLFFGLTGRFGSLVVGPNLSVGFGFVLSDVPVRLETGRVGEPLPAGIENLGDVVKRGSRPGFGVTFSLTGTPFSTPNQRGGDG